MNVNINRSPRPSAMEEAPGTGIETMHPRRPAELLALLSPNHEVPAPLRIGGLWKTGTLPQGAVS